MQRAKTEDEATHADAEDALATVTHARLRARQGDVATARRILSRILEDSPADPQARALLSEIGRAAPRAAETADKAGVAAPEVIVERLSRWLDQVKRRADDDGV